MKKIAISISKELLDSVDSKVDKNFLISRSQAIEFFLRKGLNEESIDTAIILIKGNHFPLLLKSYNNKLLIHHQLSMFYKNGIKKVFLITQKNKLIDKKLKDSELKIIESSGEVDEFILKFSVENGAVVCTNDKELKKKLKKSGVKIIQMRGKSRLEFS